ncbi:hypothetical protein HMN09_00112700 [Mycena chlorophos]|uniref:Uncharacterized protein n=1 Tax=Mycena chlorophos TaxID=658473 RepID=A0A8H6WSR6_MYCCL|nr:hypothetical protein HMN09_00112700 [Mycena chlorophos]
MLHRCSHSVFRTRPLSFALFSRRHETTAASVSVQPDKVLYRGPLTNTFRRLKIFSLSSLSLVTTMAPLMFVVESNLPMTARAFLASTALATSGVSTSLIGWAGRSYVTTLRIAKNPKTDRVQEIEATTYTLTLQPRITKIYDPAFTTRCSRPFAKWELLELVLLPSEMRSGSAAPTPGSEETVAETFDAKGNVVGRWIVRWGEGGEGNCRGEGQIIRYFNVHEELLPPVTEDTSTS